VPKAQPGMQDLHNMLVKVRDAVAEEINHLDADPPESEEQFLAQKTRLMNWWRDLSILRVQVEYAIQGG
jgi:hypothetical protein